MTPVKRKKVTCAKEAPGRAMVTIDVSQVMPDVVQDGRL